MTAFTRRGLILGGAAAAGGLLSGCDRLGDAPPFRDLLFKAEKVHQSLQRTILDPQALAREFTPAEMSPRFRTNGNVTADTPEYRAMRANGFRDWRLRVGGLVHRPQALSLDQLRSLPQRAQITRHDCVEGWSAIGKWQGPRLAHVLDLAGLRPEANYIVFRCADRFSNTPYYESIGMVDALHPQTILAWAMNDRVLPEGHGAPLRLRVERQLGYKQAKFVMAVEAVASLDGIGRGRGGYWEDVGSYEWYAGI